MPQYEGVLGATLLISIFAYFEAYFFSAIDEIIDFHGGEAGVEAAMLARLVEPSYPPSAAAALKVLATKYSRAKADRYRNAINGLKNERVVWPSYHFMLFGLRQAMQQRRRWKAHEIPELMQSLLGIDITEIERTTFHKIRENRNRVGHGRSLSFPLRDALDASNFLPLLSMKVDMDIVRKFLVIERVRT